MAELSFITEQVRAALRGPLPARSVTLEPLALQRLSDALSNRRPLVLEPGATAPIYALALLLPEDQILGLTPELSGSLVAGDGWDVTRPLRIGESLTVRLEVLDAYERFSGRFGQMLYLRCQWTFTDADGAVVATAQRTVARYRSPSEGAADA